MKEMGESVGEKNADAIQRAYGDLEVATTTEEKNERPLRAAVLAALEQVGADRRVGRAPAGHYERELHKVFG